MTGGTQEVRSDKSLTLMTFNIRHSTNGPMDQRTNGPMDQWTNGPMDQWTNGPMDPGTKGPMVQWTNSLMDHWTNGPMDQWTKGPMVQWTNGLIGQCTFNTERVRANKEFRCFVKCRVKGSSEMNYNASMR